jgi:hypothetical protein
MLDGKIRDFLSEIPGSASGINSMQQEIEDQRGWLVREKFTLGAGISRSMAAAEERRGIESKPIPHEIPIREPPEAHQLELPSSNPFSKIGEEATPLQPVSSMFWLGILLLFIIFVACAGFIFAIGGWEDLITRIPRAQGG